ncbi:hypothetical protein [Lysobacter sp. Root690]|uniref:hypothetical protein n=1 Tax=Lysobacter sp. Root690 TaxID=1736588 RepID=UPI0012FAE968|nr:hypothetical protein [Lysobacter sp. Root690]
MRSVVIADRCFRLQRIRSPAHLYPSHDATTSTPITPWKVRSMKRRRHALANVVVPAQARDERATKNPHADAAHRELFFVIPMRIADATIVARGVSRRSETAHACRG